MTYSRRMGAADSQSEPTAIGREIAHGRIRKRSFPMAQHAPAKNKNYQNSHRIMNFNLTIIW